jgi:hypothetical protein
METMVKLAVLLATLFLLTGVAFAQGVCDYYEYTYTGLDDPFETGMSCTQLCFNYGEPYGMYTLFCGYYGNLTLFFDSMNKEALAYSINNDVGYLKFHGDRLYIFNGIFYCGSGGYRYEVRGHKVESCDHGM